MSDYDDDYLHRLTKRAILEALLMESRQRHDAINDKLDGLISAVQSAELRTNRTLTNLGNGLIAQMETHMADVAKLVKDALDKIQTEADAANQRVLAKLTELESKINAAADAMTPEEASPVLDEAQNIIAQLRSMVPSIVAVDPPAPSIPAPVPPVEPPGDVTPVEPVPVDPVDPVVPVDPAVDDDNPDDATVADPL